MTPNSEQGAPFANHQYNHSFIGSSQAFEKTNYCQQVNQKKQELLDQYKNIGKDQFLKNKSNLFNKSNNFSRNVSNAKFNQTDLSISKFVNQDQTGCVELRDQLVDHDQMKLDSQRLKFGSLASPLKRNKSP
jgi:hypothetical protein